MHIETITMIIDMVAILSPRLITYGSRGAASMRGTAERNQQHTRNLFPFAGWTNREAKTCRNSEKPNIAAGSIARKSDPPRYLIHKGPKIKTVTIRPMMKRTRHY